MGAKHDRNISLQGKLHNEKHFFHHFEGSFHSVVLALVREISWFDDRGAMVDMYVWPPAGSYNEAEFCHPALRLTTAMVNAMPNY